MKFLEKAKKTAGGALCAVVALSLAFCVNGTLRLCLCDSDPDDCGEHCHECTPGAEEACAHLTVCLDAPFVPQTSVDMPELSAAFPAAVDFTVLPETLFARPSPASTGPPHSGGLYISNSTRLYPLS